MDVREAFLMIKEKYHQEANYLVEAKDFGDFFGFVFSEKEPQEGELFGGGHICVNKKTGEVFGFMPYQNFILAKSAKTIPLEVFCNDQQT